MKAQRILFGLVVAIVTIGLAYCFAIGFGRL